MCSILGCCSTAWLLGEFTADNHPVGGDRNEQSPLVSNTVLTRSVQDCKINYGKTWRGRRISQERAIEFESLANVRVAAVGMSIPTRHIFTNP